VDLKRLVVHHSEKHLILAEYTVTVFYCLTILGKWKEVKQITMSVLWQRICMQQHSEVGRLKKGGARVRGQLPEERVECHNRRRKKKTPASFQDQNPGLKLAPTLGILAMISGYLVVLFSEFLL